jgi:lauroyl/myristoyl acyltransferase
MTTQSWFDPDRVYKNLDDYRAFIGKPYTALCADMQARFDAEFQADERQAEWSALRDEVHGHLTSIAAFQADADAVADEIADGFFQTFYLEQTVLTMSAGREDFFGDIVEVRGLERVQEIIAEDGGVQFALPHYGPHFLVHLLLCKLGLRCFVGGALTDDFGSGHLDWGATLGIDTGEVEAVDFTASFGRAMASIVNSGKSLTLYPEYTRSSRLGRHTTEFLGQTVQLPTGVARLAKMSNRRLVGVRLHRVAPFRYVLEFGPFLSVGLEEGQLDVPEAAAQIMAWVEGMVLDNPEQWEGWRYYRIMKANGLQVLLRNLAAQRRRMAS